MVFFSVSKIFEFPIYLFRNIWFRCHRLENTRKQLTLCRRQQTSESHERAAAHGTSADSFVACLRVHFENADTGADVDEEERVDEVGSDWPVLESAKKMANWEMRKNQKTKESLKKNTRISKFPNLRSLFLEINFFFQIFQFLDFFLSQIRKFKMKKKII